MIVTRLNGGLGNQMFQYAAGRRLALQNNTDLTLDISWFKGAGMQATAKRVYELGIFKVVGTISDEPVIYRPSKGILSSILMRSKELRVYSQSDGGYFYNPEILEAGDDVRLEGYWQSADYFEDIAKQIRDDFTFRNPPNKKNKDMLHKIKDTNAVSLHVRRGDYANDKSTQAFHGLAPLDYYRECMRRMQRDLEKPHFFIFSDEPDWCKKHLQNHKNMTYVDINDADHGAEDMRLMAACKHHIIANSSFSWWGAWLNPSLDKIVYAPKRWFAGTSEKDTLQLIPKQWIRL